MSFQVTTAFVQNYKDNLELLLQQRGSKLRGAVSSDTYFGKDAKMVEQIGAVKAVKRLTRHGDTPLVETPHDARWVNPTDYDVPDLIDDVDKLRMIIDPTNAYALNQASALGRAMDQEIIDAALGTAKTGENGTINTVFDTANTIAVGFGAGSNTGLTLPKLREAQRLLMTNDADESERMYVAMQAKQHDDQLGETQVVSLDFQTKPVLEDGRILRYMGFDFVVFGGKNDTQSAIINVDGSGFRRCFAWVESGLHLGIWNDINVDIGPRRDKLNSMQVLSTGTFGATRTQEDKVIEILCSEV